MGIMADPHGKATQWQALMRFFIDAAILGSKKMVLLSMERFSGFGSLPVDY